MIDFEPQYITFDCYEMLMNFRMTERVRGLHGDRLDQAKMDEFVEYFRGCRLDEAPGARKPVLEAVLTWGPHPDVLEGLSRRPSFLAARGCAHRYCWGGLVDMTADRLPRAGQHEGLFCSMGYSGHGVQISVHMGRVMVDVMFGAAACNPWRTLERPAIPGHFGLAWFLPLVGAHYRLQDVLH